MTGLDPERDELIEVALVRTAGERVTDEFTTLLRPMRPSSAAAFAVHGLDAAQLAEAPLFAQVAPRLEALLCGAVPVAHGALLDSQFLARALRAAGRDPAPVAFMLDTVVLARRAVAAPRYSLRELSATLGLPARRWHRAGDDAAAVRALFARLVPEFLPPTPRDLWEVRIGQRGVVRVRQSIAAQLASLARVRTPCALVIRRRGQTPVPLVGRVERWDPPHVRLALAPPRTGVAMVRADRILRIEPPPPPGGAA